MNTTNRQKILSSLFTFLFVLAFLGRGEAGWNDWKQRREEKKQKEIEANSEKFQWWPTDATPGPVKDEARGGYWWWPNTPGAVRPWGNQGYIYVYKIIFDYKAEELPPAEPQELRPSLLIRKIIRNVKIYFDYDHADLRNDAVKILEKAVKTLNKYPEMEILVTGNADIRGSEAYNDKLARRRGDAVKEYLLQNGIVEERIKVVSRGKLDAVAPVTDIVGMQRDRNAQFMIADVEEVMMPSPGEEPAGAQLVEEGKYLIQEEVKDEGEVKVSTRDYTIQKGDTLDKIAQRYLGAAYRWKYLFELNKDRIKDPNKLKAGTVIVIPIEVDSDNVKDLPVPDAAPPAEKVPEEPAVAPQPSASEPAAAAVEPAAENVPAPSEPAAAPTATREYKVKSGDTLGGISMQELGTSKRWREIYELNKDRIKDPNRLKAGQVIMLPGAPAPQPAQ